MATRLKVVSSNGTLEKPYPFPRGAVVHLKSHSPLMTVQNPGVEWSECTWFDDMGMRMGPERFHNETLTEFVVEPTRPARKPRAPRKPLAKPPARVAAKRKPKKV